MSTPFPRLFTPLALRGVTLRNRIVSTAHGTFMSDDGLANARIGAYHEARARGGAGLVFCEAASVHSTGVGARRYATAHTDACIEPYARVVERIRAHGAAAFGQLYHPGRGDIAGSSNDGTVSVPYAPSPLPCERNQLMPRPVSLALVRTLVEAYGDAAARMTAAGFQGIEIMAHHGHLVSQFLNPRINQRDDAYGGDFEGRLRFLREIAVNVRSKIRDDMPVGVRICGDEMDAIGLNLGETVAISRAIAASGLIDYLSVNLGSTSSPRGGTHAIAPMAMAAGYVGPYAGAIKAAVDLPVIATGRINEPQIAEEMLAQGQADLCGMTRAQLCDPELANKARRGDTKRIRICIACNQACIGHGQKGAAISCIQYPESGRELEFFPRERVRIARRVLVAGGGPAGLKAAAVAAERGHVVTLYEASPHLGGQVLLAQRLPGRAEFGGLLTNLEREAREHGVEIITNRPLTGKMVRQAAPDAVIVATGARDFQPRFEGASGQHVVTVGQVLRNEANVGQRVVVADSKLDWSGVGVALMLARSGCSVRLAVIGDVPGQNLPAAVRNHALGELHALGVEVLTHLRLSTTQHDSAGFVHTCSDAPVRCEAIDTLVLAAGTIQCSELEAELQDFNGAVRVIGDCVAPRTAEEAVLEGARAGHVDFDEGMPGITDVPTADIGFAFDHHPR